uniref:Uncharacterized protein n=1 Tax=Oryza punctata TaxID=4537 RepID=A0A0E0KF24_ORYPU
MGDRQARRPARLRRRRRRHGPLAVGRAALVGAATLAAVELFISDSVDDDDKPGRKHRPLPAMTKKDDVILRMPPAIDQFPVPDQFIAASRATTRSVQSPRGRRKMPSPEKAATSPEKAATSLEKLATSPEP